MCKYPKRCIPRKSGVDKHSPLIALEPEVTIQRMVSWFCGRECSWVPPLAILMVCYLLGVVFPWPAVVQGWPRVTH